MQAQWTCRKGNFFVGSQATAHFMVFKSARMCSMPFYPGLIYAWQGALGFFFLFNLWLYSVGTCFPVKLEKEGLLCAACCVCQVLLLFLFLLLSYINSATLGCLDVCLIVFSWALRCTSLQGHHTGHHWRNGLGHCQEQLVQQRDLLIFTLAETWLSRLFASVTPLKRSLVFWGYSSGQF